MPLKILSKIALLSGAAIAMSGIAAAGPDDNKLFIDGEEIATDVAAPEGSPFDRLYSGWRFRTSETQALQADDFENPAFAAITLGEELWDTAEGSADKSCASCHGDVSEGMKGVRAEMPKWSEAAGKPQTLEQYVNTCRTERMGADAWKWESDEMLGMTALIGLQSRGMPVDVQTEGPMQEWWEKGKDLYYTRTGQLDLACASCHEANFGKMLRADHLSQGHTNGFPVYRLKWGGLGSIHRRFKGCIKDTRAEPYDVGSDELLALELYVASRGAGLSVETPSVRN